MDNPDSRRLWGLRGRVLGCVGIWLGTFALFPALLLWLQFFHLPRLLGLPSPGSPRFWNILGLCALVATLFTFSAWRGRNKPIQRAATMTPPTPGDWWKPGIPGIGFLFLVIVRLMAAEPGSAPNWLGVVAGTFALTALFAAIIACAKLAGLDDGSHQSIAAVSVQHPWVMPSVHVPVNRFRAAVTPHEVIYRRPLSARVTGIILFCFMFGMATAALWLAAAHSGMVSAPYVRENPWMSLLMLAAALIIGNISLLILSMVCPQELHIFPHDRTYTYRVGAQPVSPVLRALMTFGLRDGLHDEIGLPWRTEHFAGTCADIAGIEMLEVPVRRNILYVIRIRWHLSDRPCMRLGTSRQECDALALLAQAAEDLGVVALR